jgi:hypothetical protein
VKPVYLQELVGEQKCDLVVFKHCSFPRLSFNKLYYNKEGSSADISGMDTSNFTYMQACHFIANKPTFLDLCGVMNTLIGTDRKNPKYETWQYNTMTTYDEAYFNYYLNTKLIP